MKKNKIMNLFKELRYSANINVLSRVKFDVRKNVDQQIWFKLFRINNVSAVTNDLAREII